MTLVEQISELSDICRHFWKITWIVRGKKARNGGLIVRGGYRRDPGNTRGIVPRISSPSLHRKKKREDYLTVTFAV